MRQASPVLASRPTQGDRITVASIKIGLLAARPANALAGPNRLEMFEIKMAGVRWMVFPKEASNSPHLIAPLRSAPLIVIAGVL